MISAMTFFCPGSGCSMMAGAVQRILLASQAVAVRRLAQECHLLHLPCTIHFASPIPKAVFLPSGLSRKAAASRILRSMAPLVPFHERHCGWHFSNECFIVLAFPKRPPLMQHLLRSAASVHRRNQYWTAVQHGFRPRLSVSDPVKGFLIHRDDRKAQFHGWALLVRHGTGLLQQPTLHRWMMLAILASDFTNSR